MKYITFVPIRHFTISGNVQGVFFHAQTKENADELDFTQVKKK